MDTNTFIIKCPHCGAEKKVTFSVHLTPDTKYTMWSDYRIDCEGWLETIHTQRCPSCMKFYILPRLSELRKVDSPNNDNGQLSYETLKLAIAELTGDEFAEPWARLEAWRAYNALYQDVEEVPIEDQEFYRANMQWLVDFHTPRVKWFSLLIFELNRLLGNKEVCKQMLDDFTFDAYVEKVKMRDQEKGIQREYDELTLMSRYNDQVDVLSYMLNQPPKTVDLSSAHDNRK